MKRKYIDRSGGPAFPGTCDCNAHHLLVAKDGMSLRDWFAGQALAGLLAYGSSFKPARLYRYADAMLAESLSHSYPATKVMSASRLPYKRRRVV